MPIIEYYCDGTHTIYQFLARNLADAAQEPRCPDGDRRRMKRLFSTFAVTGGARDAEVTSKNDEFSPEQQAAAMRLSAQMENLSDDHPDPRELGRMMRDMAKLTGAGRNPDHMEEVIRRLEAGEDPDRLEDQLESVLSDDGSALDPDGDPKKSSRSRANLPVRRDPTLYELRDFLPKNLA